MGATASHLYTAARDKGLGFSIWEVDTNMGAGKFNLTIRAIMDGSWEISVWGHEQTDDALGNTQYRGTSFSIFDTIEFALNEARDYEDHALYGCPQPLLDVIGVQTRKLIWAAMNDAPAPDNHLQQRLMSLGG